MSYLAVFAACLCVLLGLAVAMAIAIAARLFDIVEVLVAIHAELVHRPVLAVQGDASDLGGGVPWVEL